VTLEKFNSELREELEHKLDALSELEDLKTAKKLEAEQKIEKLQKLVAETLNNNTQVNTSVQKIITEKDNDITAKEQELLKYKIDNEEMDSKFKINELEQELLKQKQIELKNKIDILEKSLQQKEIELDNEINKRKTAEQDILNTKVTGETVLHDLKVQETEIQKLNNTLSNSELEVRSYKELAQAKQQELEFEIARNQEFEKSVVDFEIKLYQLDNLEKNVNTLENEKNQLKQNNLSLENQREQLLQTIQILENEKKDLQFKYNEKIKKELDNIKLNLSADTTNEENKKQIFNKLSAIYTKEFETSLKETSTPNSSNLTNSMIEDITDTNLSETANLNLSTSILEAPTLSINEEDSENIDPF